MKKIFFFSLLLVLLFYSVCFSDIKLLEEKQLKSEGTDRRNAVIQIYCIDGYKWVLVRCYESVSLRQMFEPGLYPRPVACWCE